MSKWIPETDMPYDGIERVCDECRGKIQPPKVTAGYVGSGRIVLGGWYGLPWREGVFCPSCAEKLLSLHRKKTGDRKDE